MSEDFFKDFGDGSFGTFFKDTFAVVTDASTGLTEKPVYCGLMMNRDQLQTIIDNAHLFGQPMANAAHIALNAFNNVQFDKQ